jgi:hypothetical protein
LRLALLACIGLVVGSVRTQEPAPHAPSFGHVGSGGLDGSQPIPEPSTLLLVGSGLVGVALTARWRRKRN